MNAPLSRITRLLAAALVLGSGANAIASQETIDLDTRFRAKLMKEKIKMGALQRKLDAEQDRQQDKNPLDQGGCGSQSIGNIETERGAPAPREVFVFAPNAINIVGRGGCQ